MNKDFWERINRLEELANKISPKDWEYTNTFGKPALISNTGCYGVQIAEAVFAGKEEHMEYIAAANPVMIQEMIMEMRRLKQENKRLKIEAQDLDSSGGKMAKDYGQLEKEAQWLAEILAEFCDPDHDDQCCVLCRKNCDDVQPSEWRKRARKAVLEGV